MRVLNTLYVTEHRSSIRVQKGNLMVVRPDGKLRIPIESLETVVMFSGQITAEAIDLCLRHRVRVTAMRRSGRVRFTIGGHTQGNVLLRVAQIHAADDPARRAAIARAVVAGKLQSYRTLIHRWSWDTPEPERSMLRAERESIGERIAGLDGTDDGDVLRGLEGDGTRRYLKCLGAHLGDRAGVGPFLLRTRRPPRDPVNALLSFLYGMVQGEVEGALEVIGLDPQIGYLHGLRAGRASLALDLVEELRPAIADRLAVRLLTRRQLRLEHFTRTAGGATYLADKGRRIVLTAVEDHRDEEVEHRLLQRRLPVWTLPTVQATLLARHLRGDLPAYPPFVLTG